MSTGSASPSPASPVPPAAPPQTAPPRRRGNWVGALRRSLWSLFQSAYALALIGVILWLSFLAFWYLLDSLLFSPLSPPQVVDLPALRETELSRSSSAFAGFRATENPRIPLAHYHRFGPWFQADAFNDCTRGGCHGPLPHHRNKESRAFLNLHATSLHCGVCHMETDRKPLDLVWYNLADGKAGAPPAAMRALDWLEKAGSPSTYADAQRKEIISLLETANTQTQARDMSAVIQHLRAVRGDSPDFRSFLEAAAAILPHHMRGEYGVKLALRGVLGGPLLAHQRSERAIERYLAEGAKLPEADRKALLGQVHTQRAAEKRSCSDCHNASNSLIDFAKLGYPRSRVEALTQPLLMQAIEKIMKGEPFYLPGFVAPAQESGHP